MPSVLVRLVAAAALTCAVAGVSAPTPAVADEVATAQARVDALQVLAQKSTAELTKGTQAWEADRAALRRVELDLTNTRRHVAAAQAQMDAARARVGALARRLYMAPQQGTLATAVSQSPERYLKAISVTDSVNRIAGNDDQVVRAAETARHRLQAQAATVTQLSKDARALAERSEKRMKHLQELAASTADQLQSAQDALQRARAKAAAERAARARARAARARAAEESRGFSGGAGCTSHATGGQNGNLDPATLCPLWMAPGHRLRWDAAAAFNKLSQYHAATVGGPLCVTDSYRSYSEQVSVYRRKPGLAAVPGSSNHGWGLAVDFCGGIQDSSSSASAWMRANAGKFGWFHPDWAKPSGSRPEAWHWEYAG